MPVSKLDLLKNKRLVCVDQIDRIIEFVDKAESLAEATVEGLQLRQRTLEKIFNTFDSIQSKIEEQGYDSDTAKIRATIEEAFYRIHPELSKQILKRQAKLARTSVVPTPQSSSSSNAVQAAVENPLQGLKLPKLSVPIFSGDPTKWLAFNESFNSLIHRNDSISDSAKFQYLISSLSGPAAMIIESIEICDDNYPVAIKLLCDRYDNRKLIAQEHIHKLFDAKAVDKNSLTDLRNLIDTTRAHLRALETLKRPVKQWDDLVVHLITSKLDSHSLSKWQETSASDRLPTLEELFNFLTKRCQVLQNTATASVSSAIVRPQPSSSSRPKQSTTLVSNAAVTRCIYCNADKHIIYRCDKFKKLPIVERLSQIKQRNACINCLRSGHYVDDCGSEGCRTCRAKHHTLLHFHNSSQSHHESSNNKNSRGSSSAVSHNDSRPNTSTSLQSTAVVQAQGSEYIFLSTANINVLDGSRKAHTCRVLLDSGSQLSFITERLVHQLGLSRFKANIGVTGVAGSETTVRHRSLVTIQSKTTSFSVDLEVFILPKITEHQPNRHIDISEWKFPSHIQLADPSFNVPQRIDILIGAELCYSLLSVGQIQSTKGRPTLQNSVFGWLLAGKSQSSSSDEFQCFLSNQSTVPLDRQVEQFWELEQIVPSRVLKSTEEEEAENHFCTHIARNNEGRYIVRLPFRDDPHSLGNSQSIAIRRFYTIERKLMRNPQLHEQYASFISEYLSLGHMEQINSSTISPSNYFLPHHCVLKPDSSSTKLRVVFDASSKSDSGKSLNDLLMVGPTVQPDLFSIIIRFRLWQYVFTTDISKMYRQILVAEADRNYQCIVWRDHPDEEVKFFRLNTITYGTSAAPFLATRTLNQIAIDHSHNFPLASTALQRDTYVDDIMSGSNSIEDLLILQTEMIDMLKTAGLDLKKWCANNQRLLETIPSSDHEQHMRIRDNDVVKTLGLIWEPNRDQFLVSIDPSKSNHITKRTILADTMRIFDPLGLVAPIVVSAKIFLQHLWKLGLSWDSALPQKLHTSWVNFREQLSSLNEIKFDRHVLLPDYYRVEIHAFADGSERAYGSCVYFRSMNWNEEIKVALVCAKSRVTPTKSITLPRIELCAAQLTAQLVSRIMEICPFKIDQVFYYSDSTTTLAWIAAPAYSWQTFVSNRVASIQELSDPSSWAHIPTDQNPADLASRGVSPLRFCTSSMWLNGPEFLLDTNWQPAGYDIDEDSIPERRTLKCTLVVSESEMDFIATLKFSNSYMKTLRVMAYVNRFISDIRDSMQRKSKSTEHLDASDIESSLMTCVKVIQAIAFSNEITMLTKEKDVSHRSTIASLTPFLDREGILRVGGRLRNSELPFSAKHPILLPKSHSFTTALMNYYHTKYFHLGLQALLASVRQRFWPVCGKELSRKIVRRCIRCFKSRPATISQLMGDLPEHRVTPSRPFSCTGIDFLGPIYIHYKIRGKRPTKAYVALFICFATKAVHLEAVSDLSSEAFLAALKRFIGRRGLPKNIYTDNATNFVGAKNILNEFAKLFYSQATQDTIRQLCADEGIAWCTIPPRSPHFGGLWEAGVKSAKFHMHRQLGLASLTFEELSTVLVQIEAILNSRPLTPLSSDPNDISALTAGHFLIGAPLTAIAEPDLTDQNLDHLPRWKRINWLQQQFWRRWSKDYLHTLQTRTKWQQVSKNIKINTLVLLQDDNLPPLKWSLGRVIELHTGRDGLVRVVTVRTQSGQFKRAITKLAVLPLEDNLLKS